MSEYYILKRRTDPLVARLQRHDTTRREYRRGSPATQDTREVPVCNLALECSCPALASSDISPVHDGSVQSVDIGTWSRCGEMDIQIVMVQLFGKLGFYENELASGNEVQRRLSRARGG